MLISAVIRCAVLACVVLAAQQAVWGVDPNRSMSQYVRERWEPEAGFPKGSVYAISQTNDGYLWIGADRSLVRFDGSTFKLIPVAGGGLPPLAPVLGLLCDNDGTLWIQLRRPTLLRLHNGKFEDALEAFDQQLHSIAAMAKSNDGALLLWNLHGEPKAYHVRGNRVQLIAEPQAFPRSPVLTMAQGTNGELWVGTRDSGLFRIEKNRVEAITDGLPDRKVNALAMGEKGEMWVGTDAGVVRWDGRRLTAAGVPRELDGVQALSMLVDRDENLWVGTNSHGLFRVNGGVADSFPRSTDEVKRPEAVTALFEDREGSIWAADGRGLECIRDSVFVSYSAPEGLQTDGSNPLYVDRASRVWFSPMTGGLHWFQRGKKGRVSNDGLDSDMVYSIAGDGGELWLGRQKGGLTHLRVAGGSVAMKTYTQAQGLAQNTVYSVHRARDGSVWAGTVSGGVSRLLEGRFTTFTNRDGLVSNTVVSILESADGALWFATPDGLSSYRNGHWRSYRMKDGLAANDVNCLFEDSEGVLWAGTSGGLSVLRGDARFRVLSSGPGFLREPILGIEADRFGALWISGANHVFRADRKKLLEGRLGDGDVREYGQADGLRGVEGVKRHRSLVSDSRGRVWFSLNRGISVVDPARLRNESAPALVRVERILMDGQPVGIQDPVHIPGGTRRITLGYRGLSLSMRERVRFRYQLTGLDATWNEPVTAREAVYTNLGPGSYQFRVIAANPDGVWSPVEASLSFAVDPLYWQTWWFRTAIVLAAVLGPVALYRLRLRQVTARMNLRFEERLAERNRIAQELHDTLLQGFISASMQVHLAKDRLPEESKERSMLSRATELMGQVILEGRNTVRGLRSSQDAGQDLEHAFTRVPQEFGQLASDASAFRVIVEGEPRRLHPMIRDEVYRMGREALLNAFRHSRADKVELEMKYQERSLTLCIRDNGCGIDPQILRSGREGHWGLSGMRERSERMGAEFHVYSSAGGGTEILFTIPGRVAYGDYRQRTFRFVPYLGRGKRKTKDVETDD
ncbi:MAG: hypothetical protein JST93_14940 [Acidobacteria bacterium]|nr:hypothetical protein [Acidobacteriota bacterium]